MSDKKETTIGGRVGLTMSDLANMKMAGDAIWDTNSACLESPVDRASIAIDLLIAEVKRLGGPMCCDCKRNTARYDNGRCSLCDMKLPSGQQGKRV